MFESGFTTLIISNEEMNDIMKMIKSLEEFELLIKSVSGIIKNEAKEQKGGFLRMLLGTLGASLLGNLLTVKGTITADEGTIRAVEGTIRAGGSFQCCPVLQLSLKYKNIMKMNLNLMVFIQENIYLKCGAYIINLDENESIETHSIALYVNDNNLTYFDSFAYDHIQNKLKN